MGQNNLSTRIHLAYNQNSKMLMGILISVFIIPAIYALPTKHVAQRHGISKHQKCPCDAKKLCAESSRSVVLCNCWSECNTYCPVGFDRIDETTELCGYGDTRSLCTTNIVCDKAMMPGVSMLDKGRSKKKSDSSSSDERTSNYVAADLGEEDDDDYLKLSIVGFILWQIGSVGLGMMICSCAEECVRLMEDQE